MSDAPSPITRWARRIAMAAAVLWIGSLLVVFALRIGFPLELEWMEGGILLQAHRLQQGQPIYPEYGADFIPFLYTPGYAITLAGLGTIFPLGFGLGRAISVLATVAIGVGIAVAIRREGKPMAHAIAGAGLFASGWVFTYRWYDLTRPDSLAMALLVWGLLVLRHARGRDRAAIVAGVLVALSFWTKQTAATFVIASGVGALVLMPRQFLVYAATVAVVDGGGMLLGNQITGGMLWTYVYELHQSHRFLEERFRSKAWGMLVHAAPFLVALIAMTLGRGVVGLRGAWADRERRSAALRAVREGSIRDRLARAQAGLRRDAIAGPLWWTLMAGAALLVSALGYSTQWAEANAFIPGVLFGAIAVMVVVPDRGAPEVAALGLVTLQLAFAYVVEPRYQPIQDEGLQAWRRSYVWHDPRPSIPTDAARAQAAKVRNALSRAEGPVLALHRPWWSVLAGGDGHVGSMNLHDVPDEPRIAIQKALRDRVRGGGFAEIHFEGEPPTWLLRDLGRSYRVERRLQGAERVRPLSGWMSVAGTLGDYRRDQVMLVPKRDRPRPRSARIVADFEDGRLTGFTPEGRAFGRRPVRGRTGKLPLPGPYGGQWLASSAGMRGDLKATGELVSDPIVLPQRGRIELLLGSTGRRKGLGAILERGDGTSAPLTIPKGRHRLGEVRWEIPEGWGGTTVQLRLQDQSTRAALYLDDLWLIEDE